MPLCHAEVVKYRGTDCRWTGRVTGGLGQGGTLALVLAVSHGWDTWIEDPPAVIRPVASRWVLGLIL